MATRSVSLAPAAGWDGFARSGALEELVWEALATWHYMGPTANSSVWESDGGATFYLAFDESRAIIEAVAGFGGEPDPDLEDLCRRLKRSFGVA